MVIESSVRRIAVVVASFNRRQKTVAAIKKLAQQVGNNKEFVIEIILVDDNSTDGTVDAAREENPQITILPGTGKMFWNGSMRVGMEEAVRRMVDFVLWLNDDVDLCDDALTRAVGVYNKIFAKERRPVIIVGTFLDPITDAVTYGGVRRSGRINPLKFTTITPNDQVQLCDTMNGNFVLIPLDAVKRIGQLDSAFIHAIGDYDYGLRANRHGIQTIIMPGHVGRCSRNLPRGTWRDTDASLRTRVRHLLGPKGLPIRGMFIFYRRHGGWLWPINYCRMYLQFVLSVLGSSAVIPKRLRERRRSHALERSRA